MFEVVDAIWGCVGSPWLDAGFQEMGRVKALCYGEVGAPRGVMRSSPVVNTGSRKEIWIEGRRRILSTVYPGVCSVLDSH